jgi:hypothetical protein
MRRTTVLYPGNFQSQNILYLPHKMLLTLSTFCSASPLICYGFRRPKPHSAARNVEASSRVVIVCYRPTALLDNSFHPRSTLRNQSGIISNAGKYGFKATGWGRSRRFNSKWERVLVSAKFVSTAHLHSNGLSINVGKPKHMQQIMKAHVYGLSGNLPRGNIPLSVA